MERVPPTEPPTDSVFVETEGAAVAGQTRWRVVVVRLPLKPHPTAPLARPDGTPLTPDAMPAVVRVTTDLDQALRTCTRLRTGGAAVLLLESPGRGPANSFCESHPNEIAPSRCRSCDTPICAVCHTDADNEPLCPQHNRQRLATLRVRRVRQLFMLFLFAVVLYVVDRQMRTDQVRTDPNGVVKVALLQLAAPEVVGAEFVRRLNALPPLRDEFAPETLHDIAPFFTNERQRYTNLSESYLDVDVLGPWPARVTPPELASPEDGHLKMAWQSLQYAWYYEDLAEAHGVELDEYGTVIIVVYASSDDDLAAHSRGSERRRLAIAHIDVEDPNPAYAIVTVAHELAHTLGAVDNYDFNSQRSVYPEGFVQPFAEPLYPQRYAELMAVDKPLGPHHDVEIRSLDEVRIGHYTAAQLGWIEPHRARYFYEPASIQPEELLDE